MLNPCKSKNGIWFVIELCEPIQVSSLELANFELYSSTPKDLVIYGSQNYPTREWTSLGTYTASDERNLQHFDVKDQQDFMKYIKIEMQSHYGSEHYCPLSVVRAFGTTLVEEFDAIESGANKNAVIEDDPDRQEFFVSGARLNTRILPSPGSATRMRPAASTARSMPGSLAENCSCPM